MVTVNELLTLLYNNKELNKPKMKKVLMIGALGVFAIAATSCGGGGHSCDAYRKADYSKYKAKKDIKVIEITIFNKK